MDKIYVDTNIFLDAIQDRESRAGRDLGTPAKSVFSQSKACRFEVIISDWTLEELYNNANEENIDSLLSKIEEKVIECSYNEEQKKKAKESSGHWEDYLHGLIAKDQDADCIVTRNVKDFRTLSGLTVKLPSHL